MSPDLFAMLSDWVLHIMAGVLLALFSYLFGIRKAEKTSVAVKDFNTHIKSCEKLRKTEKEGDEKVLDAKLLRLEEKVDSLEGKVVRICETTEKVRDLLEDVLKASGFTNRRKPVNT